MVRIATCSDLVRVSPHVAVGEVGVVCMHCPDDRLGEVDRVLMQCQVIEPDQRERGEDQLFIMVKFRSWWRKSGSFLKVLDGRKHHYRFSIIDAEKGPREVG